MTKPVDSCIFTNEISMESSKQVTSGTSLARTSAAVIGLAISVGASSLLMPSKGGKVLAAEGPTAAESTSHNPSTQANAVATVLPPSVEATTATSSHSVGGKQLKGAAVWENSPLAEFDATSQTISRGIKSNTFSPVAQEKTTRSLQSITAEENTGNSFVTRSSEGSEGLSRQTTENEAQTTTTPKSVVSSSPTDSEKTTKNSSVNSFVPDESPIPGKLSSSEPTTSVENQPSELSSTTQGTQPKTFQSPVDSLGSTTIGPSPTAIATEIKVYQVRDGDTLNSIAATYGVSVGEIIQINNLSNPNVLNVNQTLKIPQGLKTQELVSTTPNSINISVPAPITTDSSVAPTVKSVVESSEQTSTNAALSKEEPVNTVTVPRVAQTTPIPLTADTSGSETPATIVFSPSATVAQTSATVTEPTAVNTNAMPLVVKEISTGSPVKQVKTPELNHGYGGRLRADLDRLYAESQRSTSNQETSVMKVAEASHPQERQEPRNPEYQPQNSLPTAQKEMSSRQMRQWVEKAQKSNQELSATTKFATSVTIPRATPKPSLVATAPMGADAYDPLNNPTLGRMVSPELPPLPGADRYLPGGSPQSKGFVWPSKGAFTSGYGWRWGRMHRGIDIAAPIGTPVVAADDGTVTYAQWNDGGYGYLVEITHPNGSVTLYAHNDRILVREGQQVTQGQQISEMGTTGFSTGPHLHFEIHPSGKGAVDPMAFLPTNPSVASDQ